MLLSRLSYLVRLNTIIFEGFNLVIKGKSWYNDITWCWFSPKINANNHIKRRKNCLKKCINSANLSNAESYVIKCHLDCHATLIVNLFVFRFVIIIIIICIIICFFFYFVFSFTFWKQTKTRFCRCLKSAGRLISCNRLISF